MNFRNKSIIWVGSIIVVAFAITAYFIGEKMTQSTRKMSVDLALAKANNSLLIVETEIEKVAGKLNFLPMQWKNLLMDRKYH